MKVIVAPRELSQHLVEKIEQVHKDIKLIATQDDGVLEEYWPQAEVVFGGSMDAELLARCKNLRWIQATNAGVENFLFPELVESDIMLTNVRGMQDLTVSEHVFMMMLAHARHLKKYMEQQQKHTWEKHKAGLLHNKVLLVIGLGSIGQRAAQMGAAFGMRVEGIANSPKELPFIGKTYTPDMLGQALSAADYIVVSTPLTEKTTGMLGASEFGLMKPNAFIVNIGRGPVIDEQALIKALQEGQIGGAGLDVFTNEPLEEDSPLWTMENVIITPHVAGNMPDYLGEAAEIFCSNLRCYVEGRQLKNLVDKNAGY